MKIQTKLSVSIFLTGFIALICLSGIYYYQSRSIILKSSIDKAFETANLLSHNLELNLKEKAKIAIVLSNTPVITAALEKSNAELASLQDTERNQMILSQNNKWVETKDLSDTFIKTRMHNSIANYFHHQSRAISGEFGEIFLTNRFGVMIATTKKLTTLAHSHKYWWIAAFNDGAGRVFFDDRGYDESVGGYVLGIVVPIMKDNQIIGVLKCNINILGSVGKIVNGLQKSFSGTLRLARSGGAIVYERGSEPLSTRTCEAVTGEMKERTHSSKIHIHNDIEVISAVVPVHFTRGSTQYVFGGSYKSIDHIQGNKGEGWYVVTEQDVKKALAPSISMTKSILFTGSVCIILILLVATYFGRIISIPIIHLARTAEVIGNRNFTARANITSKDELGILSTSINKMVSDLQETTASIDDLNNEILVRKQAEEQLVGSETSLNRMFDFTNHMVCIADLNTGYFTKISPAFTRHLGWSEKELLSKPIIDFIHPNDVKKTECAIKEQMETGDEVLQFENRYKTKEGYFRWLEWSAKPVPEEGITYSAAYNITDRKHAEKVLKEQYNLTTNIIEGSLDAIIVSDSHGVLTRTNKSCQEILGYSEKELIGKQSSELAPKEGELYESITGEKVNIDSAFKRSLKRKNEELFEKDHVYNWELYLQRKDRKVVPVEQNMALFKDTNGKTLGAISIIRNITNRKQIEERLRQSQKMEAIGTLAGGIAHDFNNILGGIIGYTELTQEDLSANNPVQEYLSGILNSSTRAKDLVKQILAFSRKNQEERRPLQIDTIAKEVAKLFRSTTPTTIEIKLNIEESSCMVNADPTQIHQIVMNLCTNAVYSMQDNGGVLGIDLSCIDVENKENFQDLLPGPYIKLVISDTGSGINSSILTRIFEPFFTTKTKDKGTGMGLSVVHGIVKSYGGDIMVKSQTGLGSAFTLLLPQIVGEPEKEEDIASTITIGTEHILFVDDEKVLLDVGEKTLQSLGYTVISCNSSLEALKIFEQQPSNFDLVITDQTMPHMTGYDLTKRILEIKPTVPVILCTGYSDTVSPEKAEALGVKALVYKPIGKNEIAETIREVLDKHNLQ